MQLQPQPNIIFIAHQTVKANMSIIPTLFDIATFLKKKKRKRI